MGKKIFGHLLFVAALAGCVGMTLLMGSQGTKESMLYNPVFCRPHRRLLPDERLGA